TACPGYSTPTGIPITLMVGEHQPAILDHVTITQSGKQAETCAFDASSYKNPDAVGLKRVHDQLTHFGAIVIVPRSPLVRGVTYIVNATVSGRDYSWWFAVAP